jgi:DNA repair protein RadC
MNIHWVREVRANYTGRKESVKQLTNALDVSDFIRKVLPDNTQEHFVVINLDGANQISSYTVATTGLTNSSQIHSREVFKTAILSNATSIIVSHNHPSGNLNPSKEDDEVTKRLKEAGELLGIKVLDHVIVTDEHYYSFNEQGKI